MRFRGGCSVGVIIPEGVGEITYNTCIYGCTLQYNDIEMKGDKS